MDLTGKVLGNRYEIIERIGVGGMATVYKARCRLLNRNVAIKVLKDEFANDLDFIKRFQVEAQAAASLSHPNIVSIYDVGNENNLHYIVMELIEGETLKDIINEKGRILWKDAVEIAAQIAAGLSKAHANHIVHRDIKPHNIIITKDGVAKVTDFGIAKAVSNSTINAFGSTMGSVHYFSPEHARGGYTDEKSDLYSLGVVLYEMVTGKLPFDGDSPVTIALKHLQESPKEPIEINKELPIGLNNIILKAMAKNTADRYQSSIDMHSDLEKISRNPGEIPEVIVSAKKNDEFPTQRIPIVGIQNDTKDNIIESKENEEDTVKKGVTKKQAVIRLILVFVFAVILFFVAFRLGSYVLGNLLGGTPTVEVPKVIGMEQEEAKRTLEASKLIMAIKATVESEYPAGFVASQSYDEGYKLKEGATVEVNISKGEKVVLVPNVSNTTVDAAKIEVEQRGLVFNVEGKFSNTVPSGEIIEQDPKVNSEVAVGSTVTVYVSKGIEAGLVAVPNVIGESEQSASKKISDSKLIPEITTVSNPDKENGIVISQTPVEGEVVSELSSVVLVINEIEDKKEGNENTENGGSSNENTEEDDPMASMGKRTIKISLANKGERENFEVKVVLQSTLLGTRVEYEGLHSREDGVINVDITDAPGAYLRLYIDGKLDSEQVLK